MSVDPAVSKRLLIGDLELDTGLRQVSRNGLALDLPKLSYRLLLVLAEGAPNVLTHDELIDRVWPGLVVSPETISQRIKLTRRALGDDAHQPRYIGAVRGQGYRLLADVRELSAQPNGNAIDKPAAGLAKLKFVYAGLAGLCALVLLAFLVLRLAGVRDDIAIAVLPFANASDSADDLYISEGLADELRDQLGRIPGVRVTARSSSVQFRESPLDAISIANQLRVGTLIEGQVRTQGKQLRVTVQIIDGTTGFQTWTGSFDQNVQDLLGIQQLIAAEIVQQLMPNRDDSETLAQPASLVASANELIYLARFHYEQVRNQPIVDHDKLIKAIELYRQATVADPDSALAHSRLAAALLYLGDVEAAEVPIFQAMRINPELSEVQYTLGLYRWLRYLPGSGKAFERAVMLKPSDPDANEAYGKWIWHQMFVDQAEPYLLRALEMDAASLNRYADLANFYGMSGMRSKALEVADLIATRFNDAGACMVIARIHELAGDLDKAIAWALKARSLSPDNRETNWMIAELYARIGDFERAHEYEDTKAFNLLYWERRYDEMIELGEELAIEQPAQPQLWFGLARAYVATGRYDLAIHVLNAENIPENVFNENRRANALEALVTLADAQDASGNVQEARRLASWMENKLDTMIATGADNYWWQHLYSACIQSILQRDLDALESLERMTEAAGLPWYPLLVDSPCFQKFESEPRYKAVVKAATDQMKELRDRMPETLARAVPEL